MSVRVRMESGWRLRILVGAMVSSGAWGATTSARAAPNTLPVDVDAMRESLTPLSTAPFASDLAYRHYLLGSLAADRGDHRAAIDEYRQALAFDEGATHVRTRLAAEYHRLGMVDRAEQELRLAAARDPDSAEAHFKLGFLLLQVDRPKEAVPELERATALSPHRSEAHHSLAQARAQLGDLSGLEQALDSWASQAPGEPLGWRDYGEAYLERGAYDRAERFLLRALSFVPEDPDSLAALGRLAAARHQEARALAFFERSLRSDAESPVVLFAAGRLHLMRAVAAPDPHPDRLAAAAYFSSFVGLASNGTEEAQARGEVGTLYYQAHLVPEALEQFDAAVSVAADSDVPHWRYARGMTEVSLHRWKAAIDDFSTLTAADDDFVEAQAERAVALSRIDQTDDAIASLQTGLLKRPDADRWAITLAELELGRGQGEAAVRILERSVTTRGLRPELAISLANVYEAQGRRDQAIGLLRRALEGSKDPEKDQALRLSLGIKLSKYGKFEEAIEVVHEILKEDPHNAGALNFIGYEFADRGVRLTEAEELIKRALDLEPEDGKIADSLGWVYFRQGKLRLAVETLRRADRSAPDDPEILEHLGDAYASNGDVTEAIGAYARALEALQDSPDPQVRSSVEGKLKELRARTASLDQQRAK
jgi:tetratricopeptide (TPR) repeat protein